MYLWSSSRSDWTGIPEKAAQNKELVISPPVSAVAGETYPIRLTTWFDGSSEMSTLDVDLKAVASPLEVELSGTSGDVKNDREITLDASASADPDDPAGNVPLKFTWQCTREDFPQVRTCYRPACRLSSHTRVHVRHCAKYAQAGTVMAGLAATISPCLLTSTRCKCCKDRLIICVPLY